MPKNFKYSIVLILGLLGLMMIQESCTHDPFIPEDMEPNPIDTMMVDTMTVDTMLVDTMSVGMECDSNLIYFERDILPILHGSCAIVGCHDVATASDGVILNNYENVMATADVDPFDPVGSKLFRVINENDPEDVMPPTGKLDNASINLITQWILQGAENLECDYEVMACNTMDISYNSYVKGVFSLSCNGCHSTAAAFGGVILDTYAGVKKVAVNNSLYGAINWEVGFERMPQGQAQLDSCTISKIKSWIDDGAQDN